MANCTFKGNREEIREKSLWYVKLDQSLTEKKWQHVLWSD